MYIAILVLLVTSIVLLFKKANKNGWLVVVPIYNWILLCEIAGLTVVETILTFVPLINIVMAFIFGVRFAKKFGKSDGFGMGLVFLPMIFYPILAFGDAKYNNV